MLLAIISIMVLVVAGCSSQQETQAEASTGSEGGYKNNFTLLNLEGEEVSLSDYEGKLVVLNFWATWCPPCKAEIPDFIEVYSQYQDKGVQFVGVSNESKSELVPFVEDYGINYPILIDGSVDTIMGAWGIRAIPTTYILDTDGTVLADFTGLLTKQKLIDEIEKRL
ncbi:MAG: TlpA family protein disulfide reductase [Actinomycetia bacterium]|nr:TlpA family protein disulfide reductase [Actinomycetes bacterium]